MLPDQRIATVAAGQFGCFSHMQAVAAGLTLDQIRHRLTTGRWTRAHPGAYRIAGSPRTEESRIVGVLLSIGPMAFVSVCSAASLWGVLDQDHCPMLHVSVEGRSQFRRSGVVVHRPRRISRRDLTRIGSIRLTTPGQTLIDLARHLPSTELENVVDRSIQARLVRPSRLLERMTERRRSGLSGSIVLEEILSERTYAWVSGSPAEAHFLRLIRAARLPVPEREVNICDVAGHLIGRVDFAYRTEHVAIEIDGYAYHSERDQWERDHERRRRFVDAGWLPLSFTVRGMKDQPDEVIGTVRRALRRRRAG